MRAQSLQANKAKTSKPQDAELARRVSVLERKVQVISQWIEDGADPTFAGIVTGELIALNTTKGKR